MYIGVPPAAHSKWSTSLRHCRPTLSVNMHTTSWRNTLESAGLYFSLHFSVGMNDLICWGVDSYYFMETGHYHWVSLNWSSFGAGLSTLCGTVYYACWIALLTLSLVVLLSSSRSTTSFLSTLMVLHVALILLSSSSLHELSSLNNCSLVSLTQSEHPSLKHYIHIGIGTLSNWRVICPIDLSFLYVCEGLLHDSVEAVTCWTRRNCLDAEAQIRSFLF